LITVGVIGAGRIGQIHAMNLYRHAGAELKSIVDVSNSAAGSLATACNAQTTTVEALLDDSEIDAVVIASPTDTHADLVCRAAESGKAVFCEKPLDLDVDRARRCLAVVEKHGTFMCLGFNRRHDPSFSRLKEEIGEGHIGDVEVVSITSRDPSPPPLDYIARSGGLFRDMMIHDFDMARWLLGEEPVEVYASGSVLVDTEIGTAGDVDTAAAMLTTAGGRLCQINNSRRCNYGYDQRIEVFGSQGMVRAGNRRETQVETASALGFGRDPVLPFFLERYADAYRIQLEKFVNAVAGETVELPGGDDGLRALQLANAAQLSSEKGHPIAV